MTAQANIGDTIEHSNQRYQQKGYWIARYAAAYYEMAGFYIHEQFNENGVCDTITYYRRPLPDDVEKGVSVPPFSEEELSTLISLNVTDTYHSVPSAYGFNWESRDGKSSVAACACGNPYDGKNLWALQISLTAGKTRRDAMYKLRMKDRKAVETQQNQQGNNRTNT